MQLLKRFIRLAQLVKNALLDKDVIKTIRIATPVFILLYLIALIIEPLAGGIGDRLHRATGPMIAFSIDYQGCLANEGYQRQYYQWKALANQSEEVAKLDDKLETALLGFNNLKLADFVIHTVYQATRAKNPGAVKVTLFNGSNRQFRIRNTGPLKTIDVTLPQALQASQKFLYYLSALLGKSNTPLAIDHFLLADIYENREPGYTWEHADSLNVDNSPTAEPAQPNKRQMDRDKFDIVYSQIHKLAAQHQFPQWIRSKKPIHFYFFEDQLHILQNLNLFFQKNPDLLPANTTLFLMHYTGETLICLANIKGKGLIDINYSKSIHYTYDCFQNKIQDNKLHKLQLLSDKEDLARFKAYRFNLYSKRKILDSKA
jgi:hypothetical protein